MNIYPTSSGLNLLPGRRPMPRAAAVLGACAALLVPVVCSTGVAAGSPTPSTLTILVAEQYPAITEAVTVFEKAHPNIHIQVQIVSGSAFVPKTLVEVASNNPPDIFRTLVAACSSNRSSMSGTWLRSRVFGERIRLLPTPT